MVDRPTIDKAALRLREADASRFPCPPVRDILGPVDIDAAYEVQAVNRELALRARRRLVGWKIGLTSPAVQAQLGVDQPDSGALFADCEVGDGEPVPVGRPIQPKIEAEVAFVLAEDLLDGPVTPEHVARATDHVVAAIEIVDSRIAGWDISIVDTVADNASSGFYVLGRSRTSLDRVDLGSVGMRLSSLDQELSSGTGRACLGHPSNAVAWLANRQLELGAPLRAGDTVLSGALGPMVTVEPGRIYDVTIDGLGAVRANFSEGL